MNKLTSTATVICLLSACSPADGVVFFQAQKNGDDDTASIVVRDLTAVDLEAFLGQAGAPVASDGDCDVFNGNAIIDAGGREFPGIATNAGLISMSGASGEPLVNFTFDADADVYTADPNNNNLFLAGDEIVLSGEGAGVIGDFDKKIEFPQETILVDVGGVLRGADLVVTWNESNITADEVSVVLFSTDVFAQNDRSIVCSFRDNGSGTIPGSLTNLLTAGFISALTVARVNGDNFILDPDSAIEQMQKGEEFIFVAFSSDTQLGFEILDP
jgi:hypothetical protein